MINALISRISTKSIQDFIRSKNSSFRETKEDLSGYTPEGSKFFHLYNLGEIEYDNLDILLIFSCEFDGELCSRSSKKMQFEIAKGILNKGLKDAAVFVFYDKVGKFRFSFIRRNYGDKEHKYSNWKRYTYFVDPLSQTNRTFKERIENCKFDSLENIQDVFSVEPLSKEFFDAYKAQYEKFCNYMQNDKQMRMNFAQFLTDGTNKAVRDYVKKMLGRIVFLHFLQKKGWMGVPIESTEWSGGDTNFLGNLYNNCSKEQQSNFLDDILEPLFFEALNMPRNNDWYDTRTTLGIVKIPFLNGGLFEKDTLDEPNSKFPASYFKELFEFFNEYNFTIDENGPNDAEVGVDPEMLGQIFENLLEDNKDKGAFYTPKEIVHFMCQESLHEYLCNSLLIETAEEHEYITKLLKYHDITHELRPRLKEINSAIDNVKICDPAIGSGAFPMGLLKEIFSVKQTLWLYEYGNVDEFPACEVKLKIIQNSIYGVDIEKGAVDIARLRFWLSLIVDEKKPKALPNLDYKIVVGNSLVSKWGDDIIDIDWTLNETAHGLFGADLAKQKGDLLLKISKKQKDFFSPDSDKKKLAIDIRNLKIDLLITQLELMVNKQNISKEPCEADYRNKSKAKFTDDSSKYFETLGWKNSIEDLQKLKNETDKPLHFFDWKLDFPEVMNERVTESVGFDVIIGNPPYGAKFSDIDKQFLKVKYLHKDGENESYILFLELGKTLQKINACLWYIIPSNISTNPSYKNIRMFCIENTSIVSIIDLGSNIFDSVSVDSCIFSYKNSLIPNNKIRCGKISSKELLSSVLKYVEQDYFLTTPQNIFNFYIDNSTANIISKIQKTSLKTLSDYINFSRGIEYGYNSEYVFDSVGRNRKPLIAGRCFSRFIIQFEGKYVEVDYNDSSNFKTKDIYETPKIFVRRIGKEIVAYLDEEKYYNVCDVYNLLPKDSRVDLYEILGLLNSKPVNYYFRNFFKNAKELFPKIPIKYLKEIPIKVTTGKVGEIAKKIQREKAIAKDTTTLEQEIDNLVYKLYDLTYDEVKVIDPEFSLTLAEYESITLE